jgi:colanic acid/amylovoran biosynthesis glycosyltransferase
MENKERRLALIVLSFPLTSEQFLLREFREMVRQGIKLEIFPLRAKPRSRVPEDAIPLMKNVHYTSMFFSWRLLKANIQTLFRRPAVYAAAFVHAFSFIRNPGMFFKHVALFPKTVLIASIIKTLRITHVHAHWATVPAGVAMMVSRLSGATFSVTGHATDIFARRNRAGLRAKIRAARFVTSCTQYGQRLLQEMCETDQERHKVSLCHHGLVPEEYLNPQAKVEELLIASGGRLVEKKGLLYLIRALSILRNRSFDFEAVLIGGGPLREALERAIGLHELQERVRVTGFISHDEVKDYLLRAALFVAPSVVTENGEMDGIPNLLLEAMAAGKAVVASAIPPITEVVDDGINGYLVQERDVKSLAEGIADILSDERKRRMMGEAGRQKVIAQFDLARNVNAFISLLSQYDAFKEP